MPSRIIFSDGAGVTVAEDAQGVRDALGKDKHRSGDPFSYFRGPNGEDFYVAADRVAYIEQIGEPAEEPT